MPKVKKLLLWLAFYAALYGWAYWYWVTPDQVEPYPPETFEMGGVVHFHPDGSRTYVTPGEEIPHQFIRYWFAASVLTAL